MISQEPKKYSREEVELIISNNKPEMLSAMLVGIAFNERDLNYAYKIITSFLNYSDLEVVGVAIICIAHLARIHGHINQNETLNYFREIIKGENGGNDIVMARVGDAVGDFSVYQPDLYNALTKEFPIYFKNLGF
jgi:hypothetical protein